METTETSSKRVIPERLTAAQVESLAAGTGYLMTPGGPARYLHLTPRSRDLWEAAKERGWLELPQGGHSRPVENLRSVWFHWCEATDHPYLFTQPRRGRKGWTEIQMDLIAYCPMNGLPYEERSKRLMGALREVVVSPVVPVTRNSVGLFTWLYAPTADAPDFCRRLVDAIQTTFPRVD
jgi:hypothetical protein